MAKKKKPEISPEESKRQKLLLDTLKCILPEAEAECTLNSLLRAFGSFDGVFLAPESVLRKTSGVSPEAASFLALSFQVSKACMEERSWELTRIYDTASAVEVLRPKFLGRTTEAVCMMLLDSRGRVAYTDIICEGSFSEVPLHIREVLHMCIEYQVDDVILAHNHPSGFAFPSQNDLLVTDRLLAALDSIDAVLCDHIIFAGDSYYSFQNSGVLKQQQDLVGHFQAEEVEQVRKLEQRIRS